MIFFTSFLNTLDFPYLPELIEFLMDFLKLLKLLGNLDLRALLDLNY